MPKKWFPLESNPTVLNRYLTTMGVAGGISAADILGTDPELLAMTPGPVRAVVFLYPCSAKLDAAQSGAPVVQTPPAGLVFMKQNIANACGTVAMLHGLANAAGSFSVRPGSFLERFLALPAEATPEARASMVDEDTELDTAQGAAAQQGQTENQEIDAQINLHFICFVEKAGEMFELDGRRAGPGAAGPVGEGGLLLAAAKRAQAYMALDPAEINFTLLALTGADLE